MRYTQIYLDQITFSSHSFYFTVKSETAFHNVQSQRALNNNMVTFTIQAHRGTEEAPGHYILFRKLNTISLK